MEYSQLIFVAVEIYTALGANAAICHAEEGRGDSWGEECSIHVSGGWEVREVS